MHARRENNKKICDCVQTEKMRDCMRVRKMRDCVDGHPLGGGAGGFDYYHLVLHTIALS